MEQCDPLWIFYYSMYTIQCLICLKTVSRHLSALGGKRFWRSKFLGRPQLLAEKRRPDCQQSALCSPPLTLSRMYAHNRWSAHTFPGRASAAQWCSQCGHSHSNVEPRWAGDEWLRRRVRTQPANFLFLLRLCTQEGFCKIHQILILIVLNAKSECFFQLLFQSLFYFVPESHSQAGLAKFNSWHSINLSVFYGFFWWFLVPLVKLREDIL